MQLLERPLQQFCKNVEGNSFLFAVVEHVNHEQCCLLLKRVRKSFGPTGIQHGIFSSREHCKYNKVKMSTKGTMTEAFTG